MSRKYFDDNSAIIFCSALHGEGEKIHMYNGIEATYVRDVNEYLCPGLLKIGTDMQEDGNNIIASIGSQLYRFSRRHDGLSGTVNLPIWSRDDNSVNVSDYEVDISLIKKYVSTMAFATKRHPSDTEPRKYNAFQMCVEIIAHATGSFLNTDDYDDSIIIIRPNIEHNMMGVVMGRGGLEDLGATLWGQTELSCYDDSMHGIWGMSYKYHERAMVFNERNLIRLWDVAYDGYNGGKDTTYVNWNDDESIADFKDKTHDLTVPYEVCISIIVIVCK
jgi:hypothetical protein